MLRNKIKYREHYPVRARRQRRRLEYDERINREMEGWKDADRDGQRNENKIHIRENYQHWNNWSIICLI
jgi:hypothetical protein